MACRREALPGQHTEQGVPTTVPSYDQVGARSRATFSKVLSSAPGRMMVSVNRLLRGGSNWVGSPSHCVGHRSLGRASWTARDGESKASTD